MNMRERAGLFLILVMLFLIPSAALSAYKIPVADDDLCINEELDDTWRNILLIGNDNRKNELETGRSDTMMICSINQESGRVKIISLARDTWVQIGDKGYMNKLNVAHRLGGPNLLMRTINRVYKLNISEYVEVNFYGIRKIVDAMGGVTVPLDPGEAREINYTVEYLPSEVRRENIPKNEKEATLCGAQALAYVRIRKMDNDFGRQVRQRRLVLGMVERAKECSAFEMIGLMKTGFQYVATNISLSACIELATNLLNKDVSGFDAISIPSKGHYHYENNDGTSKVIVDPEQCAQEIHAFIYE